MSAVESQLVCLAAKPTSLGVNPGAWYQHALLSWCLGWGSPRGIPGREREGRVTARGRDQFVEQAQLRSCLLDPTLVAAQRCAAGAIDHGGATRVQPSQEHH